MTRKLPDIRVLQQHIANGLGREEIATMYGCHPDSLRYVMRKAGLFIAMRSKPEPGPRPACLPPHLRREVEIKSDRIVFTREVAAGMHGGTMFQHISVARITAHVAALQDAGRC